MFSSSVTLIAECTVGASCLCLCCLEFDVSGPQGSHHQWACVRVSESGSGAPRNRFGLCCDISGFHV